MNKTRRVDIDSLRGLSVIAVIIFHLDHAYFPNGYLGVDLFFVISGYVITKSIIKKYYEGNFKFTDFYIKRIRRILPVLLVVLISSFLVGVYLLLLSDLKKFSESLLTSLGFISNFYFWITGGYFSTNDQLKPLLHLWSLSVEEQFYLFFPFFLYFLFKISRKLQFYLSAIILISLISFFIDIFFISKGHTDAIFFLFPARIWQFGLGIYFALLPNLIIKNLWIDRLYLVIAFVLIIFNFVYKINFLPDATLMSLGAALILYRQNNEKNILSKVFNIKPLVYIGLISYSLYLWHWPVISFSKYVFIDELTFGIMFFCIITIFLLSSLSWKLVEQPFLYKYSIKKVLTFVSLTYLGLTFLTIIIIFSKTLPSRYDQFPNLLANSLGSTYTCSLKDYRKFGNHFVCLINSKNKADSKSIIFGNSHAYMYGWGLKDYWKDKNQKGYIIQMDGCFPFIDKNISKKCIKKAKDYFKTISESKNIKNVIIGYNWHRKNFVDENGKTFTDDSFKIIKDSTDNLIVQFQKNKKNVYLIGPIDIPYKLISSELSRRIIFKNETNYKLYKSRKDFDKKYSKIIKYYDKKLSNKFLKPFSQLCDDTRCFFGDQNGSFFSDAHHLSYYGSMKMKKIFENIN